MRFKLFSSIVFALSSLVSPTAQALVDDPSLHALSCLSLNRDNYGSAVITNNCPYKLEMSGCTRDAPSSNIWSCGFNGTTSVGPWQVYSEWADSIAAYGQKTIIDSRDYSKFIIAACKYEAPTYALPYVTSVTSDGRYDYVCAVYGDSGGGGSSEGGSSDGGTSGGGTSGGGSSGGQPALSMSGSFGYQYSGNGNYTLNGGSVTYTCPSGWSGHSGSIALELWIFPSPYTPNDGQQGYKLAKYQFSNTLDCNYAYQNINTGSVKGIDIPNGTWYASLILVEYTAGSWHVVDHLNFSKALVYGNNAGNGGGSSNSNSGGNGTGSDGQGYVLQVLKSGAGSIQGAGIDCGSDCTETYDEGIQVTLTATPAAGNSFAGWTGACTGTQTTCTITMDAAKKKVKAKFKKMKRVKDVDDEEEDRAGSIL